MAERTAIRPHEGPQEAAHACPADILIFGGAAGGGKTRMLLVEPLRHVANPAFNAVIFRRTSPQIEAEGGMWDESHELYPHLGASATTKHHRWRFPAGSVVRFGHLQYEQNKYDWKGAQIALIGLDQLEEFTEGQFWYLTSRNRSTCGVRPYIRATANPVPDDDPVGGWLAELIQWWWDPDTGLPIEERAGVLRWFVRIGEDIHWASHPEELQAEFPDVLPKSLTFIPSRLQDNPTLMAADPGYIATLMALPLVERERLLGGNWKIRATAGTVFNLAWFRTVRTPAATAARVRYWDKAGTDEGENPGAAFTSGVRLARTPAGLFVIEDVVRGQWGALDRERVIRETAEADGFDTVVWVEQEPGSGGKESAENTIRNLAGFQVHADRVTGSKVERAMPLSAQAEGGNVVVVESAAGSRAETQAYLRRLHAFPAGKFKDDADATAGAFNKLAGVAIPSGEEFYDLDEVGGFVL